MSAAFAEIAIGIPGEPCLNFGDRFDEDFCLFEEVIKATARDRITATIDDDRGFKQNLLPRGGAWQRFRLRVRNLRPPVRREE